MKLVASVTDCGQDIKHHSFLKKCTFEAGSQCDKWHHLRNQQQGAHSKTSTVFPPTVSSWAEGVWLLAGVLAYKTQHTVCSRYFTAVELRATRHKKWNFARRNPNCELLYKRSFIHWSCFTLWNIYCKVIINKWAHYLKLPHYLAHSMKYYTIRKVATLLKLGNLISVILLLTA